MLGDSLLANVLVFCVGQVFAWLYLRTGRFWVGSATTTLLWVTLDWWLVGRYVFGVTVADQRLPLLLLQLVAAATTVAYVSARVRKRLARALRPQRFRAGMQQLLADQLEPARASFRQLVWSDPWDAAAWIALGDVLRRSGEARKARWCYRRAAGVDTRKAYADLLRHRSQAVQQPPAPKQPVARRETPGEPSSVAKPTSTPVTTPATTPVGD